MTKAYSYTFVVVNYSSLSLIRSMNEKDEKDEHVFCQHSSFSLNWENREITFPVWPR